MMYWLVGIVGFVIGLIAGIIAMCFMVCAKEADRGNKVTFTKRKVNEKYVIDSLCFYGGVEDTPSLRADISHLTDEELDEQVEFAFYLEGK